MSIPTEMASAPASSETQEQPTTAIQPNFSAADSQPNARAVVKKGKKSAGTSKPALGKLRFGLSIPTERAVRLACIMLEEIPNAPSTPQQLIEEATIAFLKKLRASKGLEFPKGLLSE
ncbi:hypothetical protein [Hymenobacter glacieicola]|uniref:Uncharacterized protein n=1 Tax=Hymenobacter glacieicola TaxID=1562124 RepID=A0ABQ1X524_9BACT|nr:hypothetical protein [Hymenobacter glacieicola]GGG60367.1 hypothetical protein GCM10011378_40430 [Hymenobacter glacieicola]